MIGLYERSKRDLSLAKECVLSFRRGSTDEYGEAGAMLEASFMLHVIGLVEGLSKS